MSDEVAQAEPNPANASWWMEDVPLSYRRTRAIMALGIGLAVACALWAMQYGNGTLLTHGWTGFIPVAIGVWRFRVWIGQTSVRKYATVHHYLSTRERVRRAAPWLLLGFGG